MIDTILRSRPYLVLYNYNRITDRVQKQTNGDMFFAFNRLKNRIELHSIASFKLSPDNQSKQGSIEKHLLNDWILRDIETRSNKRFLQEKKDEAEYIDALFEEHGQRMENRFIEEGVEKIKDMLGRN